MKKKKKKKKKTQNAKRKTQNAKRKTQNAKCKMQNENAIQYTQTHQNTRTTHCKKTRDTHTTHEVLPCVDIFQRGAGVVDVDCTEAQAKIPR